MFTFLNPIRHRTARRIGTAIVLFISTAFAIAQTDVASQTNQTDSVLKEFHALDWKSPRLSIPSGLRSALPTNEGLREAAMKAFLEMSDEGARFNILQFIISSPTREVTAQAMDWVRDTGAPKKREAGYLILCRMEYQPEHFELALQSTFQEHQAPVLSAALGCLLRADVSHPVLTSKIVQRLEALTWHDHIELRIQAIQRLAEWDRGQRRFPAAMFRLLNDKSADVRDTAIGAGSISGLTSAALKRRLLTMAADASESTNVRATALMNLTRFEFDQSDYDRYKLALAALDRLAELDRK